MQKRVGNVAWLGERSEDVAIALMGDEIGQMQAVYRECFSCMCVQMSNALKALKEN